MGGKHLHSYSPCCNKELCSVNFHSIKLLCYECKIHVCASCSVPGLNTANQRVCYACSDKYSCLLCPKDYNSYLKPEKRQQCRQCQKVMCSKCHENYDSCPACYKVLKNKLIQQDLLEEGLIQDISKLITTYE
jgi:hypothetical protein